MKRIDREIYPNRFIRIDLSESIYPNHRATVCQSDVEPLSSSQAKCQSRGAVENGATGTATLKKTDHLCIIG
jgi:hypothetical protein